MGILQRKRSNDVLFLIPVRLADEKPRRNKIRILYCDAAGKLYAPVISESVYELARNAAQDMESRNKSYAVLGLENSPGKFTPVAVEIDTRGLWALERILDHALKNGQLPDILKQYLKSIIHLGEDERQSVLLEHKEERNRYYREVTPRVLNRLPYYPENDIEISMPIYKVEYSYPMIVLKHLQSAKPVLRNISRLLILDSDGDLAILQAPAKLVYELDKGLKDNQLNNKRSVCALLSKDKDGLKASYMVISQLQRKALDTITRYFKEAGDDKKLIPAAAKAVLARAKDQILAPAN